MGERWPVSETIRFLAGRVIFSILLAVTLCMNPVLAQDQTDVVRGKWLASFSSIVMNRFYNHSYIPFAVPGALREYDLPDLAASLAPSRLIIAGMVDGNGKRDDEEGIKNAGEIIGNGYLRNKVPEMLRITEEIQDESLFRMWHINK